jgi:hypothetical protein
MHSIKLSLNKPIKKKKAQCVGMIEFIYDYLRAKNAVNLDFWVYFIHEADKNYP